MESQILATITRGDVIEATIRGHVAVVDRSGALVGGAGDPAVVTTLRSCAKPLQALPFVERAIDELAATDAELALACASHNGEAEHVRVARQLLARAGVDEAALECGPQMPTDEAAARKLLAGGGRPLPIHNNCSGKHAAMLATCAVAGWPLEGYVHREHALQREVTATLSRFLGIDLDSAPWGIDGCGLPTFGVPLAALARGFVSAQGEPSFRRCQDAMAAHPFLVAGSGRFDTALLASYGAVLTAKIGGAAVWVAVGRAGAPGLAIKLEAGYGDAIPAVGIAALRKLRLIDERLPEELLPFERPLLRNWAGLAVGEITPHVEPALASL